MYCRNNSGSMPSIPKINSFFFFGEGDSSPRVRSHDTPRMAPSRAAAPRTSSDLGNRFIFSDANGEDARACSVGRAKFPRQSVFESLQRKQYSRKAIRGIADVA